jgi:hypothetical protein
MRGELAQERIVAFGPGEEKRVVNYAVPLLDPERREEARRRVVMQEIKKGATMLRINLYTGQRLPIDKEQIDRIAEVADGR